MMCSLGVRVSGLAMRLGGEDLRENRDWRAGKVTIGVLLKSLW